MTGGTNARGAPTPTSPIPTIPLTHQDEQLRDRLIEDVAAQSTRMDELARQLITLELAVPGLYATALRLVAGEKATVAAGPGLYAALACWGLALVLALASLLPRRYEVDPNRLDGHDRAGPLSIMGYFAASARFKRRLLIPSSALFYAGICAAIVGLL